MAIYRKVSPGQRFAPSARRENDVSDVIDYVQGQREHADTPELSLVRRNTGVVTVKNSTGSDLARFGVMGISSVLFTPTDNADLFASRVIFTGASPSSTTHQGKFIVTAEPIKNGKLGYGYVDGVFPCKVDITDADHSFADVKNGDTVSLESRAHGPLRILYKETGTGVKKCVGSLGLSCSGVHFAVKVTQVGGSNGNKTTAASWTYDVKDLLGNTLATAVALTRSRPLGTMTAGSTYGIAFYDASVLKLWDAGEIPGSGGC